MSETAETYYDRHGAPLAVGDRVEFFRVVGGDDGGDAKGWTGGMPCTVAQLGGDYPGRLLLEHDKRTQYQPPHDVNREWCWPSNVIKTDGKEDQRPTVVGYGTTNGDGHTHALTGRKTVCGTLAAETAPGPADCPDCLFALQDA